MWLFLAALTMLFAATMVGYIVIRLQENLGPPPGSITLPWQLWVSTAVILASSFTMHRALQNVRAERQTRFCNALLITLLLAAAFLVLQGPAMASLIVQRFGGQSTSDALYGLVFTMVLLHALHVVGGLIPLLVITVKAHRSRYDHESHAPVQHLTMYWHFLDVIWLVMFFVLQTVG
jgi:heme/copper-type cytochrome/quinol oxidase subunit 3